MLRRIEVDGKRSAIMLLLVSLAMTGWTMPVPAQEGAQERDPFFSAGPRSTVTATSSAPDKTWGRDPFSRPFEGKVQPQKIAGTSRRDRGLTGIIYSKDVRLAILQGEAVREGSMIGDQKLVDIRRKSIVLMSSSGSSEEVFLEDFSIRK